MARQLNPALDPRLRRLVHAQADPARLDDLTASQVVVRDGGLRRSADPTTRVLVRAGGSPPTDAAPDAVWTTVAEGIYAVELPIAELEALADDPQVQFVEAARLMAPQLITSVPETGADQLHSRGAPAARADRHRGHRRDRRHRARLHPRRLHQLRRHHAHRVPLGPVAQPPARRVGTGRLHPGRGVRRRRDQHGAEGPEPVLGRPPSARAGQPRHPRHGDCSRQRAVRRRGLPRRPVRRRRSRGDDHLRAARHPRRRRLVHRLRGGRGGDLLHLPQGRAAGPAVRGEHEPGPERREPRRGERRRAGRRPASGGAGPGLRARSRQRAHLAGARLRHPRAGHRAHPAVADRRRDARRRRAATRRPGPDPQRAGDLVLTPRRAARPADQPHRRGHRCRDAGADRAAARLRGRQQRLHRLRAVLPAQRRRADLHRGRPRHRGTGRPGRLAGRDHPGPRQVGPLRRLDRAGRPGPRPTTSPTSRSSSEPTSTR